jgi:hypothetical protein
VQFSPQIHRTASQLVAGRSGPDAKRYHPFTAIHHFQNAKHKIRHDSDSSNDNDIKEIANRESSKNRSVLLDKNNKRCAL